MVVWCKKESVWRWDFDVMWLVWRGCDKVWIEPVEFWVVVKNGRRPLQKFAKWEFRW